MKIELLSPDKLCGFCGGILKAGEHRFCVARLEIKRMSYTDLLIAQNTVRDYNGPITKTQWWQLIYSEIHLRNAMGRFD